MKTTLQTILPILAAVILTATPAFAVDTAVTYKSGILVLGFLGMLALIVVAQLVPALVLMFGFVKSIVTGKKPVEAEAATRAR